MKKIIIFLFVNCTVCAGALASVKPVANALPVSLRSDSSVVNYDTAAPYALVAGGSKGIGYGIAEALARRKYNLILIARHYDSLETAKTTLESMYHVHVEIL